MNNYLIEGDSFSIKNKIDEIITNNNFKDSITSTYSLEEQSLEKPLEDLDTYSLLSNKKTIIINNIELIKKDESQNNIDHLLKYLDNPSNDNLLIITANKIDSKSTILKKIKEKTTYIKPEYKSEDIIKNYLKDYKISNVDINYLIELCNDNQIKIKNECDKLKMFCLETKTITRENIDEIVVKEFGDPQNQVFRFSRVIAENNKKEALKIFEELIDYGKHPIEILSLISSQLRTLLQIKLMEENGLKKNEIAEQLEKKPYYVEKQQELTRLYSIKSISQLIKNLQDIDTKMKSTDLDNKMLIEMYIINI